MKNKYLKIIVLLIPILFCSCTVAGIQHYFKPFGKDWYEMDCNHDNAIYSIGADTPIVKVVGKDSFALFNIKAGTDNYESIYAIGIYYIPILPDFFHMFNSHEMYFFLLFKLNVSPYHSNIKFDDLIFYLNGDSTNYKPMETWYNSDFQEAGYRFNIRTTSVKKVIIKFINVSINGTKINIPDLILERNWRFFDTMDWAR